MIFNFHSSFSTVYRDPQSCTISHFKFQLTFDFIVIKFYHIGQAETELLLEIILMGLTRIIYSRWFITS